MLRLEAMHNVPELSVSELSLALKKTVEGAFGYVRVRGELSRITIAKSGHLYTNLKDNNAVLDAVCWRGTVNNLSVRPEEGMEVICTGRLTTYPGRSNYQMVIESMEMAGEGALLKLLEERKKKLASEGLFDQNHKKELPFLPKIIGVVTSPTGAVIRDIIHRITDRFPTHILVWPVQVQGKDAEYQIAAGINGFNAMNDAQKPDVIIVARGGGSLEDLMAFNSEIIVRATAESHIPVISAVGHETDITLIDFAADKRAPTPTGAAEMAVPVRDNLLVQVGDDGVRLRQFIIRMVSEGRRYLDNLVRVLASPVRIMEPLTQRFDTVSERLDLAFMRRIDRQNMLLHGLSGRLRTPKNIMDAANLKVVHIQDRLARARQEIVNPKQDQLNAAWRILDSLSYKNILKRGYAVLRNNDHRVLEDKDALKSAPIIIAEVKNGQIQIK